MIDKAFLPILINYGKIEYSKGYFVGRKETQNND